MGSKSRIAKEIVPIIQKCVDYNIEKYNNPVYIEIFVGGANVIDKIHCKYRIGLDVNKYLIALFQYLQNGGELPDTITREEYSKVRSNKNDFPDWYVGCVGFLASYNGRFFDGGYAQSGIEKTKTGERFRDYYQESKNNILTQIKSNFRDIDFICRDYQDIKDKLTYEDCVIYLDPPYQNTKQYANSKSFDYIHFWEWVRELSKNNFVLISEQNAPEDFTVIWEQEVSRSIKANDKSKSTEKLFTYSKGRYKSEVT
jgi:DNA adenine methylase